MSEGLTSKFLKQAFQFQEEKHYKQAIEALYKALCIESDNIEILSQISHLYYLMNNFERSLEYAEKILDINPDHIETLKIVVNINKINKKYARALNFAQKLYKLSPQLEHFTTYLEMLTECSQFNTVINEIEESKFNFEERKNEKLLLIEGYARLKLNQIFKAIGVFQEIIKLYPQNTDARFYLGVIYYQKHQEADAEKLFNSILDEIQCDRTYNYLGLLKLDQHKLADAINYFQFAIKIEQNNAFYHYNLGTAYSLNGWLVEAENSFKNAVSLEPDNVVYNYALAYLYYERHDLKKALESIEHILKIDANYTDAIILKALIDAKNGNIISAKNSLQQLTEKVTNNDFLYYAMAKIYKEFPMYKEAVDCLQQALFIKPESLEYLSELADCYCELEKYDVAQDIVTKVLYLNKHFIYAHLLQAKLYLRQGKYQEATKIVDNAIKLDNSCAEAYKYKATILAAQGLKNRSIDNAKIAVSLQPANHKYYAFLAKLYFDAQEYDNAFLYYKEASMLDELNVDYLYNAALAADKDDDFVNASNYYSYALRQEPFNNLIIYEYVDLLKRHNRLKQALNLLKSKIDTVDSENVEKVLKQKYKELKAEDEQPFFKKVGKYFTSTMHRIFPRA